MDPHVGDDEMGLFPGAVYWPIDAVAIRLRLSDRLVARLPALTERLAPRLIREPAGSRLRRWVLTRALVAGFAATDAGRWDYLERMYEPDVRLLMDPEAAPDITTVSDGFTAMRAAVEAFYEAVATADSRPVELIDLGGRYGVAHVRWYSEGAYSGLAMHTESWNLYEVSDRGRVARQWLCLDLQSAADLHAARIAELSG